MRYTIVFVGLFLAILCQVSATAQEMLSISSPKTELVLGEPVFVNLKGSLRPTTNYHFQLSVNGSVISEEADRLGTQAVRLQQAEDSDKHVFCTACWVFFYDINSKRLLFDRPGQYAIRLKETRTDVASNIIRVVVRDPDRNAGEAAKLFIDDPLELLRAICDENDLTKNEEKRLREVVDKYGETRYAIYAKFLLFRREYKNASQGPKSREEVLSRSRRCGQVVNQYRQLRDLPAPSIWHAESLFSLAHLNGLAGNLDTACGDAIQYTTKYPQQPSCAKAGQMVREIRTLMQRNKDVKKDKSPDTRVPQQ